MRRLVVGTALGLLAAMLVPAPAGAGRTSADTGENPLRTAGEAAQRTSFRGVLQIRWLAAGTEQTEALFVHGANGSVVVRGGSNAAMALPKQRLVEHGGEWDLMWPVPQGGVERPDASRKYQLVPGDGVPVAGRPTRLVEVRSGPSLVERLYLDVESGLLLRREQFERGAGPVRSIGFESVVIGSLPPPPDAPDTVVDFAPRPVVAHRVPHRVSAPASLPEGYERLGVYRRSGVHQVRYSDGLYDLSVFQESGRLDRKGIPGGTPVTIGSGRGWHHVWPGGHLLLWEAKGVVYTAVSDAPFDQVLTAVRALPVTSGSSSLLLRLRRVARSLVQPLSD